VVHTRVGYTGGTTENPTYQNLGDHSEAIQIEYDPTQISFQELLDVFWDSHTPTLQPFSRQYMNILFYHNEEQRQLATRSLEHEAIKGDDPIYTKIHPATTFYPAEDYHQKYWLRHNSVFMREFRAIYPTDEEIIASTAAARVNGYLNGYGTVEALQEELDSLGLSSEASEELLEIVHRY
jgi:peptide-methionine (S)-S-oxide reductase